MGRWLDISNGRVDLVATGGGTTNWAIFRVLVEKEADWSHNHDTMFLVRLRSDEGLTSEAVRMELFDNLPDAVARCLKWCAT
jgi:hypothetical protein